GGCGPAIAVVGHAYGWRANTTVGFALTIVGLAAIFMLRKRWACNLACAVALGGWVSLIWYQYNLRTILEFAYSGSVGKISRDYGAAELFSFDAIAVFWRDNVNFGCGVLFVIALVVTAV